MSGQTIRANKTKAGVVLAAILLLSSGMASPAVGYVNYSAAPSLSSIFLHVESAFSGPAPLGVAVESGLVSPSVMGGVSMAPPPVGAGLSETFSSQLPGAAAAVTGTSPQASDAPLGVSVQQASQAGAPGPGYVLTSGSGTSEMVTTAQAGLQQVGMSYSSSTGMVTVNGWAAPGAVLVTSLTGPVVKSLDPLSSVTILSPESLFSASTNTIPRLWLDASKRRSRSQIYIEIVELLTRGPMTPFEIAFYARLNHKRTKAYLEFLKSSGYLEVVDEDGRTMYILTPGGRDFAGRVRSLFQIDRTRAAIRRSEYG